MVSIRLRLRPAAAFELFTTGSTIGGRAAEIQDGSGRTLRFEPGEGGRLVEIMTRPPATCSRSPQSCLAAPARGWCSNGASRIPPTR